MRIERWRYAILPWLRGLLRRPEVEHDLDDELRYHIERQTAANVATGMQPDAARRAALVSFGGVERIKDESRDARFLSLIDAIAQLRYAVRSLRRAPVFTIAAVMTIALGVGAAGVVCTLLNAVLLRPLPYPESDRLVGLWHTMPGIGMALAGQAPGTYSSYRASARSFEAIGAYTGGAGTITYDDPTVEPERVPASGVTASVFPILRVHPLLGRVLIESDELDGAAPVVVISERYWRRQMNGTQAVLGQPIRIDGVNREIVGVLPASFAFPGSNVDLWMAIHIAPGKYLGTFGLRAIARLRPGVDVDGAQRELETILIRVPETFPEIHAGLPTAAGLARTRAVPVVHLLRDDAVGGFGRILWLVAAIVALLVIVALSNVASLVLARAEARQREFAIRSTLGASALRICWSLVAEAAMVSIAGGGAGIAIAAAALTALGRLGPANFPDPMQANGGITVLPRLDEVHPDWVLAAVVLALVVLFCLIIGLIGTWRVVSTDAGRVLREGGRSGTSSRASQRMRAMFVMIEVALSLVLLSGSAVLGRSVLRLLRVQPGFDATNVLTFWTTPSPENYRTASDVARFYRDAVDRLARVPGIVSVGVVSKPPLEFAQTTRLVWIEDVPPMAGTLPPNYPVAEASPGYFDAMGIPVIAGRVFEEANVQRGVNEALVSREFVRRNWGDSTAGRAVGRRFREGGNAGPWYTIVGVVGDVRDTSLAAPAGPEIYLPQDPGPDSTTQQRTHRAMAFVVRTRGTAARIADALRQEIHAIDRSLPIEELAPMTETVARANSRTTFVLLLLGVSAAVTLALGVVGLYGVIAYVVSLRTREIGIRIALGLTPGNATRMILKDGEIIIVAGAAFGLLVFVAFARLLRSLAFEISVVDGTSLAAATAVVITVASLATWLPARRASQIDPADALKNE